MTVGLGEIVQSRSKVFTVTTVRRVEFDEPHAMFDGRGEVALGKTFDRWVVGGKRASSSVSGG